MKNDARKRGWRWFRRCAFAIAALEVLYVVTANIVLSSGLIPHLVEKATPNVKLHWDRAWTVWPGQSEVTGFSLQLEDTHTLEMDLRVDHATTHIELLPLLFRRIVFDHTRAHGVVFRMLTKVDPKTLESSARRVAAFPHIDGLSAPPVKPAAPAPEATDAEIDALVGIEMRDVVADMKELWFDEYRYVGSSHVTGAFALQPLKELWVGPAWLTLDGGKLSAGEHTLLPAFTAAVDLTINKVSLLHQSPAVLATTLDLAVRTVTAIEDIGVVGLYVDGVETHGSGTLRLDVAVRAGKISPRSTLELSLPRLRGVTHGYAFDGQLDVTGGVTDGLDVRLAGGAKGKLTTPRLDEGPLVIDLDGVSGTLVTTGNTLDETMGLAAATGEVRLVRIVDTHVLSAASGRYVPVIAPAVLGTGPLTGQITATYLPEATVVRLKRAELGGAQLSGAMRYDGTTWSGAAAGKFGAIPVGLLIEGSMLKYRPSADDGWLAPELLRRGITTASAALPGASRRHSRNAVPRVGTQRDTPAQCSTTRSEPPRSTPTR